MDIKTNREQKENKNGY